MNGTFAFNLLVTNELILPRLTQRGVKFFHKKVESFQEVSGDVEPGQSGAAGTALSWHGEAVTSTYGLLWDVSWHE